MNKLIMYGVIFLINLHIVLAQTGLFSSDTAQTFALTGIILIVIIIIIRNIAKGKIKLKTF